MYKSRVLTSELPRRRRAADNAHASLVCIECVLFSACTRFSLTYAAVIAAVTTTDATSTAITSTTPTADMMAKALCKK